MEKYLEEGELTIPEIKAGIRQLVISGEAFPVLCGSAFKNRGVQPMLDAVIEYPALPRWTFRTLSAPTPPTRKRS